MLQKIRSNRHANTFIILTRYLLGFAFIPSGLVKLMGERFTQISTETQIGYFFEGLYQSGMYWNFIGFSQLFAGFLLMTQRFATLGAIIFFFIISNIWIITVTMHFTGTWIITSLMLLAVLMLLVWDSHKLKFIFYRDNTPIKSQEQPNLPTYNKLWVVTGLLLFFTSLLGFSLMNTFHSTVFALAFFSVLLLIGLSAILINEYAYQKNKKSEAST